MVVPGIRGPAGWNTKAWTDDILGSEDNELDPEPCAKDEEGMTVGSGIEKVVFLGPEVGDREETEDGLAEDEGPCEGATTVSAGVAVNLGYPEREVQEYAKVKEEGAETGIPS